MLVKGSRAVGMDRIVAAISQVDDSPPSPRTTERLIHGICTDLGTVSFLLAVVWGRPLITLLKRWGMGKQIRVEEPDVAPDEDRNAHHGRHPDRRARPA